MLKRIPGFRWGRRVLASEAGILEMYGVYTPIEDLDPGRFAEARVAEIAVLVVRIVGLDVLDREAPMIEQVDKLAVCYQRVADGVSSRGGLLQFAAGGLFQSSFGLDAPSDGAEDALAAAGAIVRDSQEPLLRDGAQGARLVFAAGISLGNCVVGPIQSILTVIGPPAVDAQSLCRSSGPGEVSVDEVAWSRLKPRTRAALETLCPIQSVARPALRGWKMRV